MCACMFVCMYVGVCVCVCMLVCVYVCMYARMYACMHLAAVKVDHVYSNGWMEGPLHLAAGTSRTCIF